MRKLITLLFFLPFMLQAQSSLDLKLQDKLEDGILEEYYLEAKGLVQKGADISTVNSSGQNILVFACTHGDDEFVGKLIEEAVLIGDDFAVNFIVGLPDTFTPLMAASGLLDRKFIIHAFLLERLGYISDAQTVAEYIKKKDSEGHTALMVAASFANTSIVKDYVKKIEDTQGVDAAVEYIKAKDKEGLTAIDHNDESFISSNYVKEYLTNYLKENDKIRSKTKG